MDDVLILGGGVIGLSLAYELAGEGLKVRVIDRSAPGQEASWAGAGILPPAVLRDTDHPLEQLAGLSHGLHATWAERLRADTGADNGYRQCGGVYLARSEAEASALDDLAAHWRGKGIPVHALSAAGLVELEPSLLSKGGAWHAAYHVPDEAQIRNPRHLKALLAACAARGVQVTPGVSAEDFETEGGRVRAVLTTAGPMRAGKFCVTSGAWSRSLLARLKVSIAVKPIRGQMALLACQRPVLTRIINVGPRYLVPRPDGRVLAGSTEEDAGFDRRTTCAGVEGLLRFALELAPALGQSQVERSWAGLRPATADGLPYLGAVPGFDNAFVAAGHFRGGLHLSPGTAVMMSQLIRGVKPDIDLAPFRVDRL